MSHLFGMHQRNRRAILNVVVFASMGVVAACGPSRSAKQTDAQEANAKVATEAKDTNVKRYNLTGRVVSVDRPTLTINVDGDAIPGFMAAMTMPYQVKDAGVLVKLSPGDQIKAEIVVANDGAYLENIVVAQKAPSPSPTK
jgi:protein SCO1